MSTKEKVDDMYNELGLVSRSEDSKKILDEMEKNLPSSNDIGFKSQIEEQERKITLNTKGIDENTSKNNIQSDKIQDLANVLDVHSGNFETQNRNIQENKKLLDVHSGNISQHDEFIKQLKIVDVSLNEEIQQNKSEILKQQEKQSTLESSLDEQKRKQSTLESELDEQKSKQSTLESGLDGQKSKHSTLESELSKQQREISQIKPTISEQSEKLSNQEAKIINIEKQNDENTKDIKGIIKQRRTDKMRNLVSDISKDKNSEKKEKEQEKTIKKLKEEIEELKLKNTDPQVAKHIIKQNEINSHIIKAFASIIEDTRLNSRIRRSGFGLFF